MLTVAVLARPMRSAGTPMLLVQRVRTKLARRSFSVAGPTVFNSLPLKIRLSSSIDIFKRHLDSSFYYAKCLCIQGHYRRYINAVLSYLISCVSCVNCRRKILREHRRGGWRAKLNEEKYRSSFVSSADVAQRTGQASPGRCMFVVYYTANAAVYMQYNKIRRIKWKR